MAQSPIPVRKQFVCDCGREYIRKEHLQRHKATHGLPLFTCSVCDGCFTRLDLLRRHSKIHGVVVPDSRKDPACDACHASKTKCSGGSRCSRCRKRDNGCTYQRADLAQRMAEAIQDVVRDLSGVNFPPTRCQPSRATTESPKESLGAPNSARGRRLIAVEFSALAHMPSLEAPENDHTEAGAQVIARAMSVLCDRGESDALLSLSPKMRESG